MILNIVIALLIYRFVMFLFKGISNNLKKFLQKIRPKAKAKSRFLNKILIAIINRL